MRGLLIVCCWVCIIGSVVNTFVFVKTGSIISIVAAVVMACAASIGSGVLRGFR